MFASFTLVLFFSAFVILIWGSILAGRSGKPEYGKDIVFMVKTFWTLFFGSILWFAVGSVQVYASLVGTINLVSWFTASWWCFVFAVGLAWKAHVFNGMIRELKKAKRK
jgi:hypothetical protein